MENNLKPCPFCGNEEIKIENVISKKDILTDVHYCSIDFRCDQCKMVKNTKVYGVDEEDCKKEAVRLWNRRTSENERV